MKTDGKLSRMLYARETYVHMGLALSFPHFRSHFAPYDPFVYRNVYSRKYTISHPPETREDKRK